MKKYATQPGKGKKPLIFLLPSHAHTNSMYSREVNLLKEKKIKLRTLS